MINKEKIIDLILKAGEEILNVYHSADFEVEIKNDNSPLTKADKAAHRIIMAGLKETGYPVLSEEGANVSYDERKNRKIYWLVDPLDGTKEFIKKNGEFTVNIALIYKNTPLWGFVFAPVLRVLYYGKAGEKAFKRTYNDDFSEYSEKEIKTVKPGVELVIVASRSHLNEETKDYIEKAGKPYKKVSFIQKGSSLKLVEVAEGKAHLYPRLAPTMEWDTAAAHAVVLAAGGTVNKPDGTPLVYNKEDLLNPWFIVKA
jgi:3'(2'), 5'-bisphosphate nucleotidase